MSTEGAIFDLATPPGAHKSVLERIPVGSGVLIQKPMGADLDQATEILKVCRDRKLAAAVNFQLRFAPMMLAVRDALDRGLLGRLVDVEVHLAIDTPWGLFAFLKGLPRVEIAVHSIHYLDLIRGFLGDPKGVHAKTIGHLSSDMAQTRTTAILDYGNEVRSAMSINHNHAFGRKHQVAEFRFDGTEGAAHAKLGLLLDYPRGEPDELSISAEGRGGMDRGSSARLVVSRRFRRQNGEPAAFLRQRGSCADRIGRRRLDDDGASRGGLRIERQTRDAAQGAPLMAWILVRDATMPRIRRLPSLQRCKCVHQKRIVRGRRR